MRILPAASPVALPVARAARRTAAAALLGLALLSGGALAQPAPEGLTYDPHAIDSCLSGKADWSARTACIGVASGACMAAPGGASTAGMTDCLEVERLQWDARMNHAYDQAMARAKSADRAGREGDGKDGTGKDGAGATPRADSLRDMQRKWIAFRDAACANAASWYDGGSAAGPALQSCLMEQTGRQALALEDLVEGDE